MGGARRDCSVLVRREKTGKTPRPPRTYSTQHKSAMSGGGRMSAAIAQHQVDMMEWRSTGVRRSRSRATQDAASCDGCRPKPVSLCAPVPPIGGAVVPLFTLSSRPPCGGSRLATSSASREKPDVNSARSGTGGPFGMALPETEAGGYRRRPRAQHRPRQSRAGTHEASLTWVDARRSEGARDVPRAGHKRRESRWPILQ